MNLMDNRTVAYFSNTTLVGVYDNMLDGLGMYGSWIMRAEEIAKVASQQRNANRLQSYIDRGNMAGYEKAVNSNLKNWGNKYGMTPEQAFEKYGSWEMVLEKATSANAGMDACCGLYDDFYYLYPVGGK